MSQTWRIEKEPWQRPRNGPANFFQNCHRYLAIKSWYVPEREREVRERLCEAENFFFFSALGFLPSPELLSQPPCRPLPLAGSLPLKPRFHTPDKPGFLLVSCLAIFHRSLHTLGEVSLHRAPWHNAACRFQFIPRQTVDCISLAPLDHVFHENDGIL